MSRLVCHGSVSRVAAVSVSALALALASACGSSSGTTPDASKILKTDLVVGAVAAETSTALYIAQQRGIFTAHGLNVTIKTIVSTDDVVPDLLHGTMQVASGQVTSFISAQAQGLGPFRVLASGLEMGPGVDELMASKASGITSTSALSGKTVAENAATGNGPILTYALLAANGMKPSQVTPKVIPFASMASALAADRVDAAYCSQPYCQEMQNDGDTVVADLNQGKAHALLIGGYTVTASWATKYPHVAAEFTAAISQASKVADTNHAADVKAFEGYLKATPKVADVMATGTFPTTVSTAKLQQVANLMQEFGELKSHFNAASIVG
jgi:NitT/TauT family transport system substrate-binding protein